MKTYVTFGQVHIHKINGKIFDKDCVAVINAENAEEGRKKAFELFSKKFSFEYSEREFKLEWMKFFHRGLVEVE